MNRSKSFDCLSISVLAALLGACNIQPEWIISSHESEKYSFVRFLERAGEFPYAADERKRARVKEGIAVLYVGMQKNAVKGVMGEPYYEMVHYKREGNSEALIYSTWGYYLKRFARDLSNEDFDEAVVLYFKPNEELYWADPRKMDGFNALGGPHLHPEAIITFDR